MTTNPAPDDEVVDLLLPCCPDCGLPGERVHARRVGTDIYRVTQVPMSSTMTGLDDVVIAIEVDGEREFVGVIERRCLGSFSFELPPYLKPRRFVAELRSAGASYRRVGPRSYLCNVDSAEAVQRVCTLLERHRVRAKFCDHSTLCWHSFQP